MGYWTSEQTLRQYNEREIREALRYTPPFAKEMVELLYPVRVLLIENGFRKDVTQEDRNKNTLAEKTAEILKEYTFRPQVANPVVESKRVARRISKIIHPDITDQTAHQIFSSEERNEALEEVLAAANTKDAHRAHQILIETMPKIYIHRIMQAITDGKSFAEIGA